MMVPLKYLGSVWKIIEMPLIICEINLTLTWYESCFIAAGATVDQLPTFALTEPKVLVLFVTL